MFGNEKRPLSRHCLTTWKRIFPASSKIQNAISVIDNILESRINVGGLRNELNGHMVKFNLTNNFKWKEQTEQVVKTIQEDEIDMEKLTEEELKTYLKLKEKMCENQQ